MSLRSYLWRLLAVSVALAGGCSSHQATQAPADTYTTAAEPPKPDAPSDLEARLGAVVSAYADRELFSGTVLVARGGDVVFANSYGMADVARNLENNPQLIYRIGSVSKQFTAALVLQLVEQSVLDVDAAISTYLPDYPRPQGDQITLRMLLSHTSGIPNYTALPIYLEAMLEAEPPEAFMAKFTALPLEFEPGSTFRYSNSGYYVLGVILERVTGKDLPTLLRTRLFEPLKLNDTRYDGPQITGERRAKGYTWDEDRHTPEQGVDPSKIFAAGMLRSTAHDLLQWTLALHAGTPFRDPETRRAMTELPSGKDSNYQFGLGLVTLDLADEKLVGVGHGGGLEGFQSSLLHLPAKKLTVVVLCNSGEDVGVLADALVATAVGAPPDPPLIPLSREFARLTKAKGLPAAEAWIAEVTSTGSARLSVDPKRLMALGSRYLTRSRVEEAVAVFGLGVQVSPDSADAHEGLGDALRANHDETGALTHYRRALELAPDNEKLSAKVAELSPN